jgi:hypothetical protein
MHEACMLEARLQRLLTALLMTSELAADLLESATETTAGRTADVARAAQEARGNAQLYRELASRLTRSRG